MRTFKNNSEMFEAIQELGQITLREAQNVADGLTDLQKPVKEIGMAIITEAYNQTIADLKYQEEFYGELKKTIIDMADVMDENAKMHGKEYARAVEGMREVGKSLNISFNSKPLDIPGGLEGEVSDETKRALYRAIKAVIIATRKQVKECGEVLSGLDAPQFKGAFQKLGASIETFNSRWTLTEEAWRELFTKVASDLVDEFDEVLKVAKSSLEVAETLGSRPTDLGGAQI